MASIDQSVSVLAERTTSRLVGGLGVPSEATRTATARVPSAVRQPISGPRLAFGPRVGGSPTVGVGRKPYALPCRASPRRAPEATTSGGTIARHRMGRNVRPRMFAAPEDRKPLTVDADQERRAHLNQAPSTGIRFGSRGGLAPAAWTRADRRGAGAGPRALPGGRCGAPRALGREAPHGREVPRPKTGGRES